MSKKKRNKSKTNLDRTLLIVNIIVGITTAIVNITIIIKFLR